MNTLFFKIFTAIHTILYRLTGGKFGSKVQGLPVLLLTTTGRKTGRVRTTPLGHFTHNGGYVIIASNAGFDTHPGWFHNLKSNPRASIQVGEAQIDVTAEIAGADQRSELWEKLVKLSPGYAGYAKKTNRTIPVVILHPVAA